MTTYIRRWNTHTTLFDERDWAEFTSYCTWYGSRYSLSVTRFISIYVAYLILLGEKRI